MLVLRRDDGWICFLFFLSLLSVSPSFPHAHHPFFFLFVSFSSYGGSEQWKQKSDGKKEEGGKVIGT